MPGAVMGQKHCSSAVLVSMAHPGEKAGSIVIWQNHPSSADDERRYATPQQASLSCKAVATDDRYACCGNPFAETVSFQDRDAPD